jgi:hypothetical protein
MKMSDLSAIFLPLFQSPEFRDILKSSISEVLNQKDQTQEPDDRCDLETACEILGTPGKPASKYLIYRETHKGTIPFTKFGARLIFSRKKLIEWRDARTSEKSFPDARINDALTASAEKKLRK